MSSATAGTFGADLVWPVGEAAADGDAFAVADPKARVEDIVLRSVARPMCLGFAPQRPNGIAVLVIPGGGYTQLVAGKEGIEIAHWLRELGYHAFVLLHRFPGVLNGAQAPVDDAIEAMRLLRARAAELSIGRVGALGLSSGGHLAACLVANYPSAWLSPGLRHERFASRPDFLIVGYAPISTNAVGRTVVPNKAPLTPPEKQALYDGLQPDAHLVAEPPPAFIFASANDQVVPVENARRLHDAYERAGGSAELHIFADAPHGFALRTPDLPAGKWPVLCAAWLDRVAATWRD